MVKSADTRRGRYRCGSAMFAIGAWFATSVALAAPVDSALKKAGRLTDQMKFAEVVALLDPYRDLARADVEFLLANAQMELAVIGKRPAEIGPENIQPAIEMANRAIEHGDNRAFNLLYLIYANGWGVRMDTPKSIDYLRRGTAAGDGASKLNYAISLYQGGPGVERDLAQACPLMKELAADKQMQGIVVYYQGLIVMRGECGRSAPDKPGGVELIRMAAKHGVRDAERETGRSYEFGWAGPADLAEALRWYGIAAQHGDAYAEWRIGMSYVKGEGHPADPARAVNYFKNSAESGNTNGMTSLAVMYVTGNGVAQDFVKARELYERAAVGGNAHAYRELAAMHARGEGTSVDLVRAQVLLDQAVEFGDKDDPALRKLIADQATPAQREQAATELAQWRARRAKVD